MESGISLQVAVLQEVKRNQPHTITLEHVFHRTPVDLLLAFAVVNLDDGFLGCQPQKSVYYIQRVRRLPSEQLPDHLLKVDI